MAWLGHTAPCLCACSVDPGASSGGEGHEGRPKAQRRRVPSARAVAAMGGDPAAHRRKAARGDEEDVGEGPWAAGKEALEGADVGGGDKENRETCDTPPAGAHRSRASVGKADAGARVAATPATVGHARRPAPAADAGAPGIDTPATVPVRRLPVDLPPLDTASGVAALAGPAIPLLPPMSPAAAPGPSVPGHEEPAASEDLPGAAPSRSPAVNLAAPTVVKHGDGAGRVAALQESDEDPAPEVEMAREGESLCVVKGSEGSLAKAPLAPANVAAPEPALPAGDLEPAVGACLAVDAAAPLAASAPILAAPEGAVDTSATEAVEVDAHGQPAPGPARAVSRRASRKRRAQQLVAARDRPAPRLEEAVQAPAAGEGLGEGFAGEGTPEEIPGAVLMEAAWGGAVSVGRAPGSARKGSQELFGGSRGSSVQSAEGRGAEGATAREGAGSEAWWSGAVAACDPRDPLAWLPGMLPDAHRVPRSTMLKACAILRALDARAGWKY